MGDWALPGYTEVRELGEGGFGRVVLARHEDSGTHVAVKYLTANLLSDRRFLTGFRAEAQILRHLDSPYIARLYDFVESPQGAAIVMEAVAGISLRALLKEHGPFEPEAALTVLKGSLLGLSTAHERGVVHRDYKPPNVLVRDDGESKLIDFGIALRTGAVGEILGTPPYMAPEQWQGAPATPATDVYAATCVFFECVTGRTPFRGDSTQEYRTQHTNTQVPLGDLPEAVRGLVAQGMAKHPAERPAGAAALVAELEQAATAAYGPDWESNGRRRLAEAAAGLAALLPFAALLASGSGAPAGGGAIGGAASGGGAAGAGGGAGSTAGGGAAGAGHATGVLQGTGRALLSGTGAKVGAAIAGAVVVGSAGTAAVVVASGGGHPAARSTRPAAVVQPVSVNVASSTTTLRKGRTMITRYVQVSGLKNAAVQTKVNKALRTQVDRTMADFKTAFVMPTSQSDSAPTGTLQSAATVGLGGPKLLSVTYTFADSSGANRLIPVSSQFTLVFDLSTGGQLGAADLLLPAARTNTGARALARIIAPSAHGGVCLPGTPLTGRALGGALEVAPTATGMTFTIRNWIDLGCPHADVGRDFAVPYARLGAYVRPEIVTEAKASKPGTGAGTASPTPTHS
ncbi:hypothetical protein GCM10029978_099580 [Actinoallomurus acanthiterrae]